MTHLDRAASLQQVQQHKQWDFIIIGGGAAGLGCALEATARGYSVLLLEKYDFAAGTSSRSSKMIHGGVRYLKQGNISLVRSALRERDLLADAVPSLVKEQRFIIPLTSLAQLAIYTAGMRFYDLLARDHRMQSSHTLSATQVRHHLPALGTAGLKGGIAYSDGVFDDARLAISIARTAAGQGAYLLNYAKVDSLLKTKNGNIAGVRLSDKLSGRDYEVKGRLVINATGIFVDELLRQTNSDRLQRISQGSHIVLAKEFLPGKHALLVPQTSDDRVLFCIPWHDHLLVGTTDIEVDKPQDEPCPRPEEIAFLLDACGDHLANPPKTADVLSSFAGQRPLPAQAGVRATKNLSREHRIAVTNNNLVSIIGGKWTTYRLIAEEAVLTGLRLLGNHPASLPPQRSLPIDHRIDDSILRQQHQPIHPQFSYTTGDIIIASRYEMACTLIDVMARRTRMLMLDVRAAREATPTVAKIMAQELNQDQEWVKQQQQDFQRLSQNYLP